MPEFLAWVEVSDPDASAYRRWRAAVTTERWDVPRFYSCDLRTGTYWVEAPWVERPQRDVDDEVLVFLLAELGPLAREAHKARRALDPG